MTPSILRLCSLSKCEYDEEPSPTPHVDCNLKLRWKGWGGGGEKEQMIICGNLLRYLSSQREAQVQRTVVGAAAQTADPTPLPASASSSLASGSMGRRGPDQTH